MRLKLLFTSLIFLLFLISNSSTAQSITGTVRDANTNETLIGASVVIKGTTVGSTVDLDGNFEIKTDKPLPLTLVVSFIGYVNQEIVVKSYTEKIRIKLNTDEVALDAVEIIDTRISEKQQQAALTVEAMDVIAIKEAPSGNFYEGLANLKGVDLTSASLGFKVINTRGFNSTSPVRSLQLIDGVDNQSPGLNFSLGNFLGSSDLDVMKVDIIAGASSAFYGPNAFNGVINMTTKSPFLFPGLSASVKVGERNLTEYAARWAQVFKNKDGKDRFAYKLNIFYFKANDWEATNYDPVYESKADKDNPGGFDAVNIYGDEALNGGNDYTSTYNVRTSPGLGTFYRTGYREEDLVDYNTNNLKTQASVHYKLTDEIEMILGGNYSTGSTVYQGDNRYRLKDIQFYQSRFEIKKENDFFFRAYLTGEDAGKSYDIVQTGFLLNTNAKSDGDWYREYLQAWNYPFGPGYKVKNLPGWPALVTNDNLSQANQVIRDNLDFVTGLHNEVADQVNNSSTGQNDSRYVPGTGRFDTEFNDITDRKFTEGGSRFFDRSKLYHFMGEKKFTKNFFEFTIGANYRIYTPNSQGTIFSDTLVNRNERDSINNRDFEGAAYKKITNSEFGIYGGIEKKFFEDKLKATGTIRLDKNQNFNAIVSPAISLVYSPKKDHTFRLSFSSALRNPTLADQYLYYNVGRAILLGNLEGKDSLATVESLRNYVSGNYNRDTINYFSVDPIRPERVKTIELGYRGTLWNKLYIDLGYYFSFYNDFIGYKIGVEFDLPNQGTTTPIPTNVQAYRVAANAKGLITTQGASIGLNYYFHKKMMITTNYSWNQLNLSGEDEQIIPAFNTPLHKTNIGISGRDLVILGVKNWGFNVNYKWIDQFLFEGSPQFSGIVPSYSLVDAQINYSIPKFYSTIKLGASNLLNQKVFQVYGGPTIGRLAYISVLFDWNRK